MIGVAGLLVMFDDWHILYVDGKKIFENHSLSHEHLLDLVVNKHPINYFYSAYLDDVPQHDSPYARFWDISDGDDTCEWEEGQWWFPEEIGTELWNTLTGLSKAESDTLKLS